MNEPTVNEQIAAMTDSVEALSEKVTLADEIRVEQRFLNRLWKAAIVAISFLLVAVSVLSFVGFLWLRATAESNHESVCVFKTKHDLLVDKLQEAVRLVSAPQPGADPGTQAKLDKFVVEFNGIVEEARVSGC